MKLRVAAGNGESLLQLLQQYVAENKERGYDVPRVLICRGTTPSRDLLRGPDGKPQHITTYPTGAPWVAMPIFAEFFEELQDAGSPTAELEGVKYLVLAPGLATIPELELSVDGDSINVRSVE